MQWTRRSFLKGLGALALGTLAACERAQRYAVQPESIPEWLPPGESACYASCMPWANGAIPLLAVCYEGLPVSLQPNPAYTAQAGLPAFVQASLLDLYSPERPTAPTLGGSPLPWQGMRGNFRAWARAIRAGRRTAFLFPAGYSAVREAQIKALQALPAVSCFTYDPVAEPHGMLSEPLATMQQAALGKALAFSTTCGSLEKLTAQLPEVDLLFIFTPADPAALNAAFAEALEKSSAETVRFSHRPADETATRCLYTVPLTHYLEEWGAEADAHGNLCLRQPVLFPAVPAVSELEALHALLHDGELPPEKRKDADISLTWMKQVCPDYAKALKIGFLADEASTPSPLAPLPGPTPYLHPWYVDGRYLHNAWLKETYDPISGAAGAPAVYLPGEIEEKAFAVRVGRYVLPAQRIPGLTAPCIPLLPGITQETEVQLLPPGENPYPVHPLRPLPPQRALEPPTTGGSSPRWGMIIDLSLCVGCGACTLACRAENNIPLVGAEEQRCGRDIQWLRIDRYISTNQDGEKKLHFVPAACRQCGQAPCEAVCPVNATVHTDDGLNAMVYPRCWGTRYCAAACPYHARSFNFHDYARSAQTATALPPNPQVTVRSRGVMEKCTYCVQRIQAAKRRKDGSEPIPACQQACPKGAIRLVDWAHTPLPPRTSGRFDTPGTQPATIYQE